MDKELTLDFFYTEIPEHKNKNKTIEKINKFYHSYWYLMLCLVLCVLAWKFRIPDIAFVPMMVLFSIMLFTMEDITPFIPGFFMLTNIFPPGTTPESAIYLIGYIVIVIPSLIYHLVKFKPKKTLGKMFKPQLVVSIVLILGGLGSNITPDRYLMGMPQGIAIGVGALALYLLFLNYTNFDGYDYKIYFAKAFTSLGLSLAVIHILILFFDPNFTFTEITHQYIDTGSMLSNNMATFYFLTMPFAFYLAIKLPKYSFIHICLGTLQYLGCIFTYSNGGILFGTIEFLCCAIYTLCVAKQFRWKIVLDYIFVICILLIIYGCAFDVLNDRFRYILSRAGLVEYNVGVVPPVDPNVKVPDDITSGRLGLYKEGWDVFKQFPAFGAGLGYTSSNQVDSAIAFFLFHSTFIQIIACLGIVGLLGYVYYYYQKIKIVFSGIKKNSFQAFVLFAFIGFEGYSLIDCGTFIPMPFVFMTIFMMLAIEVGNKQQKANEEEEAFNLTQIA